MAQKNIFTDLNFNGNQLINVIVENVASLPPVTAEMAGRMVFLSTDKKFYRCNGSQWLSDTSSDDAAVTIVKSGNTYTFYQGGEAISPAIDIPKDMVVESGSIVQGTWSDGEFTPGSGTGKALALVIANGGGTVYIDVNDLVDAYTGGTTSTITVAISETNEITATLVNGSIVQTHLSSELLTTLQSTTITDPTSSSTQATAGKKTIASLFQTVVNNIKYLFEKVNTIPTIIHYQSDPLVGTSGTITGTESGLKTTGNMPILQANKEGEVIEIAMTWTTSGDIKWSSNIDLTGEENVTIVAMQKL